MEKRKQWSFRMTKGNAWSWRSVDANGREICSEREFETLAECIVNAKLHGYVVWTVAEERRREDSKQALE